MATKSTPDQNDPKADNRAEYSVPPVASEPEAGSQFTVDDDGFTEYPEAVESDDSVAS